MKRSILIGLALGLAFGAWAEAEASNRDYRRGRYRYKRNRCRGAIYYLERAIKKPGLSRKESINTYKWLALCYYKRRRYSKAKKRFRAALRIEPKAGIPRTRWRRARRFFYRVLRKFRKSQRSTSTGGGGGFNFSIKKKKPGSDILLPDGSKKANTPAPSPFKIQDPPGDAPAVRPKRRPPSTRIENSDRMFDPSNPSASPKKAAAPPSSSGPPGVWDRHKISILSGIAGVVIFGIGIAVGAMFQEQKDAYSALLQNRQNSGESLEQAHLKASELVGPANGLLLTGGLLIAAAGGIFALETMLAKDKKPKGKK